MGNKQSSLKPETAKEIPEDLVRFDFLLYNTEIDMKKKSQEIQGMLREIGDKMRKMDYETISLYSGHFAGYVDYVMENPDGKQIITAEVMRGIAILSEELKALEKKKSPSELHQQLPVGIANSEDSFLKSIPEQHRKKIKDEKVFKRIMNQSPHFIDNTREDLFIKYVLSSVLQLNPDVTIDNYYKTRGTPIERVMFIYIRKEEQQQRTGFSNGLVGWVMIFWNASQNSWNYIGLNFDPSIEFSESAKSFILKTAESMSVLEDQKIPTEAEYFNLLRAVDFSLSSISEYDLFENNVYEKMLGQGMRDSSGEYKILINQLTDSNYGSYEVTIDRYHKSQATDRNKIIFMDCVKKKLDPFPDSPFILMSYWSIKSAKWISLQIKNEPTKINFMKQQFELNKLYEPSFTHEQNVDLDRARYARNARIYQNIFQALASGNQRLIQILLYSDSSLVNAIGSQGNTPLMYVIKNIRNIDPSNIHLLLDIPGINLNLVDINGMTALHLAVKNKLEYILIHALADSDINAKDRYGLTALDYAAIAGDETIVKLILMLGANPELNRKTILIGVSENVKKIIEKIGAMEFKEETDGLFVESNLQKILFELYGLDISNSGRKKISIPIAMELFSELNEFNEFNALRARPMFSLPVARPVALDSRQLQQKEDSQSDLNPGDIVRNKNTGQLGTIVSVENNDVHVTYDTRKPQTKLRTDQLEKIGISMGFVTSAANLKPGDIVRNTVTNEVGIIVEKSRNGYRVDFVINLQELEAEKLEKIKKISNRQHTLFPGKGVRLASAAASNLHNSSIGVASAARENKPKGLVDFSSVSLAAASLPAQPSPSDNFKEKDRVIDKDTKKNGTIVMIDKTKKDGFRFHVQYDGENYIHVQKGIDIIKEPASSTAAVALAAVALQEPSQIQQEYTFELSNEEYIVGSSPTEQQSFKVTLTFDDIKSMITKKQQDLDQNGSKYSASKKQRIISNIQTLQSKLTKQGGYRPHTWFHHCY